ncbi:hypothetical protein HHK36_029161 [Tetracentron sinense]|uniref:Uncharacterized protein n=1 Tax=Tetracentron sinense TaxID=13715 RepID=A0A834YCS2_TETSI|nr:hypothetical protein HHK36_029161 [Tetracentron sinense]
MRTANFFHSLDQRRNSVLHQFQYLDNMMELEVDTNGISEEANFEVFEYDADSSAFGNERCGICMDIIIDRGVLDCCQHWFCFACIDNWATITNLCPLCQNEFLIITCVPVYDTIGSSKVEEDSLSRDDDWCVQGKNNTLSFPSYYIDENVYLLYAVICLDGDGCKIRSSPTTIEEDSNLDTSIACDSCDIWYHAFCVGFDTEGTSENSWLCPRCVIDEVPQKTDGVSVQRPSNQCGPQTASVECLVEAAFSGKVSVSVADAGETAVVVSMVEEMQWTEELSENFLSALEVDRDWQTETISCSDANSPKLVTQAKERTNIQPNSEAQETSLALSLSRDTCFSLPCNSLVLSEAKTKCVDKAICKTNGSDGCKISTGKLFDESHIKTESSENGFSLGLHLGLSVGSFLSGDHVNSDTAGNQLAGDVQQYNPSEDYCILDDELTPDANEDVVEITGVKRKCTSTRTKFLSNFSLCCWSARGGIQVDDYTESEDREARDKIETKTPGKKARTEGNSEQVPMKGQVKDTVPDDTQQFSNLAAVSKDNELRDQEKEAVSSDIMSIVRGTDSRPTERPACPNPADNSPKERDNAAGLRVKKIMRRAAEDKESSMVVQKLRKEIREAVSNKSSEHFGKNIFDPELLAAFRAAVGGPRTEPVKKLSPLVVRVKKSMLQKGKIRENLTKKIYGTASGKRRRAWDRDLEVEFWKHRCMRTPKLEKVETLRSVLDLLKKSSESTGVEEGSEGEATNPILSRLYLADASVFPRKDNIQPLSVLNEQNKEHNLVEKVTKPISGHHTIQTPSKTNKGSQQTDFPSFDNKGKKGYVPSLKSGTASKKEHPNGLTKGPNSISLSGGSKVNAQTMKEMAGKSDDTKTDKRKWALEVLARKTAPVDRNTTQGRQEDNVVLKGNYPLLAQLPIDMRPVLAPSRHNKVPMSVRQVQLYRMTEHFLRIANLPVICRTADTELAVADAVNIEKEVVNRANSKLVYVNLCSQVLSQHTNNSKSSGDTESSPPSSAVLTERSEQADEQTPSDPAVEEALRLAGLMSDTPPSSPHLWTKDLDDEDAPSTKVREEEGPDNVFDMDFHAEMDIYGDFEYDLDDEDYIGASALRVTKLQPKDEDPKMMVVFSTLNSERSNKALDSEGHERSGIVEVPKDSPSLLKCHKDRGIGSSTMEIKLETPCLPAETLQGEGDEEPSLAECEALYGPDKEPLIKKFPEKASREPDKLVEKEVSAEKIAPVRSENCGSNKAAMASEFESESCAQNIFVTGRSPVNRDSSGGENSPNHSLTGEHAHRKETKSNNNKQLDISNSISKKVEAYIKEHIRPLCKSDVITPQQYKWAVAKTTDKVMKFHFKAKNANFLIKEGEKVKKLAEQYVEAAQQKKERQ